jgi:hypothetical protein
MQTLIEATGWAIDRLELSHYKCDLESNSECYAEQYGDGNADEHSLIGEWKRAFEKAMDEYHVPKS